MNKMTEFEKEYQQRVLQWAHDRNIIEGSDVMRQLLKTCTEASKDEGGTRYGFVYVDQESFEQHKPATFAGLVNAFREYQYQKQEA